MIDTPKTIEDLIGSMISSSFFFPFFDLDYVNLRIYVIFKFYISMFMFLCSLICFERKIALATTETFFKMAIKKLKYKKRTPYIDKK